MNTFRSIRSFQVVNKMSPSYGTASLLPIQNMMHLVKALKLPVAYRVNEINRRDESRETRDFVIIVHVLGDHAFKKYLGHCSRSDLMLFRGLLLRVGFKAAILVQLSHSRWVACHASHACHALHVQVSTSPTLDHLISAQVLQAFLPKFENEGQDSSIADAIVAGATERFMVITIKHSGSLVTLSGTQGFAAKNSLNNEFTAGRARLGFMTGLGMIRNIPF